MIRYIFRVAVSIMFYGFTASLFAQEVCNSMSDDVRFDCTNPIPVCELPYTFNYDETQQESNLIYEINDHFNGSSIDGWIPSSTSAGLGNVNERLSISKTGGSGVLGAYKNFNAIAGKTYKFKATVEKGNCNPATSIRINIKDNGGNVIYTETQNASIFTAEFTFVPVSGGSYTVEIIRIGNNSSCTFYLDDITLTYQECNPKSMWHVFYIGGSNITLGITDNNSELFNAKLYGPFVQGQTNVEETCGSIANGSLVPVAVATALTNNSLQLSASNLTAGWYLLEIIDNDCKGCIEITAIEGQVSCFPQYSCESSVSGARTSCGEGYKICELPYSYSFDHRYLNGSNVIADIFTYPSIDGWNQMNSSTIDNQNGRLNITGNGNSGVFGAYKNFNAVNGQTYSFSAEIYRGNCNAESDIVVNIKNNNNIVIKTFVVTSAIADAYGFAWVNFLFTTTSSGMYTIEIFKEGVNPDDCTFQVDQVKIVAPGCNSDESLWQYFYVDNSGVQITISDDNSSFAGVKVYGPFASPNIQEDCQNIYNGGAVPIINENVPVGQSQLTVHINNGEGWYKLEIIDNDCVGCINITESEGNISCGLPCPPNSTCESIISLCEDAHVEAPCDCGTGSGSKQLWYKFDVNDPMQEFDITGSVLPFGGGTASLNFTYTIVKLVPGVFNCNPNQETAFVATGNQSTSNFSFNQTDAGIGTYILVIVVGCDGSSNYELDLAFTPQLNCFPPPPCEDCIGSFKPLPEGKYVLSAWVKESGVPSSTTTYLNSSIKIHLYNADYSEIPTNLEYYGQGAIIDEWQRLEGEFIIPDFAAYIGIELIAQNGDAYFDDIRVSPFDASMKSYVYDPVNLRLVAELDERNYATFYEYDEEGKLIRVKKETERGIMTIQETRYNTSKK